MADTVKQDKENEESLFRTLLNKVPANMRFLAADLIGMDSPAGKEKFTEEGLGILKEAATTALDKGKSSMSYEDYPGGEMNFNKNDVIDEGFRKSFSEMLSLIVNSSDKKKITKIKPNEIRDVALSFAFIF